MESSTGGDLLWLFVLACMYIQMGQFASSQNCSSLDKEEWGLVEIGMNMEAKSRSKDWHGQSSASILMQQAWIRDQILYHSQCYVRDREIVEHWRCSCLVMLYHVCSCFCGSACVGKGKRCSKGLGTGWLFPTSTCAAHLWRVSSSSSFDIASHLHRNRPLF